MTIPTSNLRTLALGALASLAAASSGQSNWTETTYQFTHTPHHDDTGQVLTGTGSSQTWTESAYNYFSVTGSIDNTPPWRLLFANLTSPPNSWTTTTTFNPHVQQRRRRR